MSLSSAFIVFQSSQISIHPGFSARCEVCVRNDTEVMMMRENSSDGPGKSGDGLKPGCEKMVVAATAAYFHIFHYISSVVEVVQSFSGFFHKL